MVDVNVKGVLYGNAATLPVTNPQVFGERTNVSSISGPQVSPAGAVYCATKYAATSVRLQLTLPSACERPITECSCHPNVGLTNDESAYVNGPFTSAP